MINLMNNIILIVFTVGMASCLPQLYLYDRDFPNNGTNVIDKPLSNTKYNQSKSLIFVIHGLGVDHLDRRMQLLKDQLLIYTTDNIILVNWKKTNPTYTYITAIDQIPITALKIFEFIKVNNVSASNVHCIGHSFGAHLCGFIGKTGKLKRISGLDPAGPLFTQYSSNERLSKNDADFVDVIHTDKTFGIQIPIGHKDFYPFGGHSQVGCEVSDFSYGVLTSSKLLNRLVFQTIPIDVSNGKINIILNCSHQRAIELFAASLNKNCTFQSVPCDNYDDFKKRKCICEPEMGCSYMGYFTDQNRQEGKFYLQTSASFPFCNK